MMMMIITVYHHHHHRIIKLLEHPRLKPISVPKVNRKPKMFRVSKQVDLYKYSSYENKNVTLGVASYATFFLISFMKTIDLYSSW